jgi:isopentenyl phosphate kinase
MILAGEVDGLFTADPNLEADAVRIAEVTPQTLPSLAGGVGGSHGFDVTGGMSAKVAHAMNLIERFPGLEIVLCSGLQPGKVRSALAGDALEFGTRIHAGK